MKYESAVFLGVLLLSGPATANPGLDGSRPQNAALQVAQDTGGMTQGAPSDAAGIRSRGIWMEMHFGSFLQAFFQPEATFGSGVVLGYKIDRLVLGLGLDLTYRWNKDESATPTTTNQDLSFALGPVVEYLLGQFGPVGFFVTAGGHFLMTWSKTKDNVGQIAREQTSKSYGFDFKAGSGGRYYFGGRVGLGLELGLSMFFSKEGDEKTFNLGPYSLLTVATIW